MTVPRAGRSENILERPEGRSLFGTAWRPFPTELFLKGVPYRAEGPFPTERSGNGPGAVPGPNRLAID